MPSHDKCLFCRIASDEIPAKKVHEDGDVVAFHDINPQAPTHVLVIPRKHIPSLNDLTEADAATIGTTVVRAAQIARDLRLHDDGYRQTVFHIHVHLLGGRRLGWPPG
jgi:histidine triad (HIT) family protein